MNLGCIAEIVYGEVECDGKCEKCHWYDRSSEDREKEDEQ